MYIYIYIGDIPIQTSIYRVFSVAMFDYRRVWGFNMGHYGNIWENYICLNHLKPIQMMKHAQACSNHDEKGPETCPISIQNDISHQKNKREVSILQLSNLSFLLFIPRAACHISPTHQNASKTVSCRARRCENRS